MWRVDDAITKYHPDLIYFDEHSGNAEVDLGVHMGLDFLSPQICANYYNKYYKWSGGKMDAVCNLKGLYTSFKNNPELIPLVAHSLVNDFEFAIYEKIESIYGTQSAKLWQPKWGRITSKGNKQYLHVFDMPVNKKIVVNDFIEKIVRV